MSVVMSQLFVRISLSLSCQIGQWISLGFRKIGAEMVVVSFVVE